ncbi:MAG: hypothetical protein KatS3mg114_1290 [Planctomycetaceae bacterium]|nr:MAG: hypothetical protein KatS3mg114_1290 [Planctomycetaceae bacterium]
MTISMKTSWRSMLVWCVLCRGVWAADAVPGEKLVPPDTGLFFTLRDIPECVQLIQQTQTGAMLRDPVFAKFLQQIGQTLEQSAAQVKAEVGLTPHEILGLFQGQVTFALIERPTRKLGLTLIVGLGDRFSEAQRLIRKLEERMDAEGEVTRETRAIEDARVQVIQLPQQGNETPWTHIAYTLYEKYWILSTEVEALREVVKRVHSQNEESLADNEVYRYILKQCGAEKPAPLAHYFINPVGVFRSLVSIFQDQVPQAGLAIGLLPILGLDKFKGFGGTLDLAQGEFDAVEKVFFYVEQPPTGILGMFNFPAGELAPPDWVPGHVAGYTALNWDVQEAYRAVEALFDTFQGMGSLSRILDSMAVTEGNGIHPKKDLIDSFEGRVDIVFPAESQSGNSFPLSMALKLKDSQRLERVLKMLAERGDLPITQQSVNGHTLYKFEADDANMHLAISKGVLLISFEENTLRTMLEGASNQPLSQAADYQKIARHFPSKVSIVSFFNSESSFVQIFQALQEQENSPLNNLPADLDLPKPEEIEAALKKYLRPSGGYCAPDRRGALMVYYTLK